MSGLRRGRNTKDQIVILEKCFEQEIYLHIPFVDFEQVFDRIDRKAARRSLLRIRILRKVVTLTAVAMKQFQR